MSQTLTKVIKAAMQPLSTRFGLRVIDEEEKGNYTAVLYSNETTGLKVAVDWSEMRPFLTIYELVGGDFPPEPATIGIPGFPRRAFDVDDLLLLRPVEAMPVGKMFARRDDQVAGKLLADYASAIEQRASDVLAGEFTVFEQLDRIVTEREQRLRGTRR